MDRLLCTCTINVYIDDVSPLSYHIMSTHNDMFLDLSLFVIPITHRSYVGYHIVLAWALCSNGPCPPNRVHMDTIFVLYYQY